MYILSTQREQIPNLGAIIWESPAAVAALLSEIISAIPHVTSISTIPASTHSSISTDLMNRVCNAMTLFQSIAENNQVLDAFLKANLPAYLFPFLHITNQSQECEHFKVAALGVIATIAMSDSASALEYLWDNDFLPLCLRILKFGQEIQKIFAAYIMRRILSTEKARFALKEKPDRIPSLVGILNIRVLELAKNFNQRLSRNICWAYDYVLISPGAEEKIKELADFKVALNELKKIELSPKCDEQFFKLYKKLIALCPDS